MLESDFWKTSRTMVRFPRAEFQMDEHTIISCWGSCFAHEMFDYLSENGLESVYSPFGIQYNPVVISDGIDMILDGTLRGGIFKHMEFWRHDAFHSSQCLSIDAERTQAIKHFNRIIGKGKEKLQETDLFIITLGTSYIYKYVKSGKIVNNCHKQINSLFSRELAPEDTSWKLMKSLKRLKEINNKLNVVLSVSPVRHLRDNACENSLSKSKLRCLCHNIAENNDYIHYFPSFEIMMDELRDYRWYKDDLTHPSGKAVKYIFSRFFEWCGSPSLMDHIKKKQRERKKANHIHRKR